MELDTLKKHKFQLIVFCYVYHPEARDSGKIQINNDSHTMHICQGYGSVSLEKQKYPIKPGDVVSVPPFTPFSMTISDHFEMMNIHYKIWLEDNSLLDNTKRLPFIFSPPYFKWCRTKLLRMKNIQKGKQPKQLPDAFAHEIILRHLSENPMIDVALPISDERMQKLQEHLEDPALIEFDSDELAAISCISKSQMNRKFRKLFGVSPQKYWEKQRMKNICLALKTSSCPICEIGEEFGFTDQGYFCRWFKKMTGYTPSEYRKKLSLKETFF